MLANFKNIKLEIFGESHSDEIGMVLSGIPKGTTVAIDFVQSFVDRRKSGNNAWSTPRKEADIVEFSSGLEEANKSETEKTCDKSSIEKTSITNGEPIVATIKNTNKRSADYDAILSKPRPSHADYVASVKGCYQSGGGKFSGRMTAPLCIAGAIAIGILRERGIEVGAYISEIGGIKGKSYKEFEINLDRIRVAQSKPLSVLEDNYCEIEQIETISRGMEKLILQARDLGDSVGGAVECVVFGLPVGLGDAMFDGLESSISYAVFAIPAIKAIEFGSGFDFSSMRGSEANDELQFDCNRIVTTTNHNGGINGGISNGMPLTLRVGVKPTPSIAKLQKTVDLKTRENTTIEIAGRHDACIVPRVVPCVESAVALAILDAILESEK